tara:strand:- start:5367 stop:5603 length:237 start_codon:yes stop_codon:yes gene_type:complete
MKKYLKVITMAVVATSFAISNASAFQAAPQSAEKAKEMMDKKADKGKAEETKAKAEMKKMEGKAKAEAAKTKPKPPTK